MLKKLLAFVGVAPKFVPEPLPCRKENIGAYEARFEQAAMFSKSLGFTVPRVKWIARDLLDDQGAFLQEAARLADVADFSSSGGQCLKWCHYLRPYVEQALSVPVWLTIGQLWKDDRTVFNPSWNDFRSWTSEGIDPMELIQQGRDGVNFHAWLTVATGEIIEPSLMSSIALVRPHEADAYLGAVVWGRDPGLLPAHRYLPMVVGDQVAEAMNQNPNFPLLARSRDELEHFPMVMAVHPSGSPS